MRNIKSRADQFSLIIHGLRGRRKAQEGFLGKEGAEVCGTHRCVPGLTLSYSRILMRHILWQHPGNLKFLPSDFCCHNCCHKGKESECGSNCGSKNPRIRLFQDAAASCATLKSESQTQNPSVRLKKSLMAPPLSCTFYIRTPQ